MSLPITTDESDHIILFLANSPHSYVSRAPNVSIFLGGYELVGQDSENCEGQIGRAHV